jgi:hypothetical protein
MTSKLQLLYSLVCTNAMLLGSAWLGKHMGVFTCPEMLTEHLNAVAESRFSFVVSCCALAGGYIHELILLLVAGCALPLGLLGQTIFRHRWAVENNNGPSEGSWHWGSRPTQHCCCHWANVVLWTPNPRLYVKKRRNNTILPRVWQPSHFLSPASNLIQLLVGILGSPALIKPFAQWSECMLVGPTLNPLNSNCWLLKPLEPLLVHDPTDPLNFEKWIFHFGWTR